MRLGDALGQRRRQRLLPAVVADDRLGRVGARREHREDPARQAARAGARHVEMAVGAPGGQRLGPGAQQRVVVAVEDRLHSHDG